MAQTQEEIAKLLKGISLKVETLTGSKEVDSLTKDCISELKTALEERYSFVQEEFNKIKKSFDSLNVNQSNQAKTEDMRELFESFSNNMSNVTKELLSQKEVLEDFEKKFSNFLNDKTDKADITECIKEINTQLQTTALDINSNIQSIFQNLISLDSSAQNDLIRQDLENINITTNAILSSICVTDKKKEDLAKILDGLVNQDNFEQSQIKLDSIIEKEEEISTKINNMPKLSDLTDVYKKFDEFSGTLKDLRTMKETLNTPKETNDQELIEKILSLREMINQNVFSRDEKFAKLQEKLDGFFENVEKISTDSEIKIGNSISEISDIKTEINDLANSFREWSFNQESSDTNVINMISTELNEIGTLISVLKNSIQSGINEELTSNTNTIESHINRVVESFEEFKQEIRTKEDTIETPAFDFENAFKEFKDKINAIKQEVNLINTDIIDVLTSKTDSILMEIAPLKTVFENFSEPDFSGIKDDINKKIDGFEITEAENIKLAVNEIKDAIDEHLNSNAEDIKSLISTTINKKDNEVLENNTKIKELLDAINQKIDIFAMSNDSDTLDEIYEIKDTILSQKELIKNSNNEEKLSAIEEKLEELVKEISNVDNTEIAEMQESVIASILNVFEQISFIEEAEDIKDFVEEKTFEINQNLDEVKQQLKQIANSDNSYSYTLQDVESDIAKLRLVINEISTSSSGEDISDISENIHKIVSSVEDLQCSLTQEQISGLKIDFEKLNEDIISISSRTNKLLLTSDESYNALSSGLNDFSKVISQLEERINYLDNKEITERIEEKLDYTLASVTNSVNSDKVMRQALIYMGEWIDTTTENLATLCEHSNEQYEKINGIQEIIEQLNDKMPEQSSLINTLAEKFDEQQNRMDRLELKLEKILSAMDNLDDTKLTKKVDKIDKQLVKLGENIEKLTSYVDQ